MEIIVLEKVELGYCDQCDRPTIVGVFLIRGWKHKFSICDPCLENLGGSILRDSQDLFKKN
ncbi:MAG: hypothetical protein FJ110_05575 [Deltaproteobacteria bacterium]|nr:hypothetical protein [Deltaproteobacteria bacterium]